MSLADDLRAIEQSHHGKQAIPRLVDRILASLDGDDRAALEQALADDAKPATTIAYALQEAGYQVAHQTISRWRADRRRKR